MMTYFTLYHFLVFVVDCNSDRLSIWSKLPERWNVCLSLSTLLIFALHSENLESWIFINNSYYNTEQVPGHFPKVTSLPLASVMKWWSVLSLRSEQLNRCWLCICLKKSFRTSKSHSTNVQRSWTSSNSTIPSLCSNFSNRCSTPQKITNSILRLSIDLNQNTLCSLLSDALLDVWAVNKFLTSKWVHL